MIFEEEGVGVLDGVDPVVADGVRLGVAEEDALTLPPQLAQRIAWEPYSAI